MTRAGFAAALLALLPCLTAGDVLRAAPAGQTPALEHAALVRLRAVTAWADAVIRHKPGTLDGAVMHVAGLPGTELRLLWLDVQELLGLMGHRYASAVSQNLRPGDPRRQRVPISPLSRRRSEERTALEQLAGRLRLLGENRFLLRATWLHTDVILLAEPDPSFSPSSAVSTRFMTRVDDGEASPPTGSSLQWDFARALLETIVETPADSPDAKAWYQATLAYMLDEQFYDMTHAQRAIHHFPDDATILFQLGCLHEVLATEPVQRTRRSVTLPRGVTFGVGDTETELDLAEAFLRRALEVDPSNVEARVHRGRVIGLRGRHEHAADELRKAAALEAEPLIAFYADLFLGAEEEAVGRSAAARDAYTRALGHFPQAQSPQMALSHLARTSGSRTEAVGRIDRMLDGVVPVPAETDGDVDDPWWIYHASPGRHAPTLIERARAAAVAVDSHP